MHAFIRAPRRWLSVLFACGVAPCAAWGQAPPPFGFWATGPGNETLYVGQDSNCKFEAQGVVIVGQCSWNPSARGGVLTIMNVNQYQPAPVYYNVVWIDRATISVFGDIFHRRN